MKTLKDFMDSRIKEKKDNSTSFYCIDANDFYDKIFLLKNALAMSVLTFKPIIINNFDFFNERISAIIESSKILSNAKVFYENKSLNFHPKKLNFSEKNFIFPKSNISEIIETILPIIIFSPKNLKLNFEGMTEYQRSIDYLSYSIIPFLKIFGDIELKVLERAFVGEIGKVELTIKPKFRFNKLFNSESTESIKSIESTKPIEFNFKDIYSFSQSILNKLPKNNFVKNKKNPISIRAVICSSQKNMELVTNQLQRPLNLILKNTQFPINIKTEFSKGNSDGISITLYAIYSVDSDIDFSRRSSFDILSKSIIFNKIDKKNIVKILSDAVDFCENIQNKNISEIDLHNELLRDLMIFDFISKNDDINKDKYSFFRKFIRI